MILIIWKSKGHVLSSRLSNYSLKDTSSRQFIIPLFLHFYKNFFIVCNFNVLKGSLIINFPLEKTFIYILFISQKTHLFLILFFTTKLFFIYCLSVYIFLIVERAIIFIILANYKFKLKSQVVYRMIPTCSLCKL